FLNQLSGIKKIVLTGGEPILREDFKEIVMECLKTVDHIEIFTNGIFYKKFFERIKEIINSVGNNKHIHIFISLDGIPNLHDSIRGIEGNFKRAILLFTKLNALAKDFQNLKVSLSYTISSFNAGNFKDFFKFVNKEFKITLPQISLNLAMNAPYYNLPPKYFDVDNEFLKRVEDDINFWFNIFRYLPIRTRINLYFNYFFSNLITTYLMNKRYIVFNDLHKYFFVVDPFGNVYNHFNFRKKFGNIKKDALNVIKKNLFEKINKNLIGYYFCPITSEILFKNTITELKYLFKSLFIT
ncbi:MAG: hypothetical protein QXS37_01855, partial [Candidatus Aenigmatarchaeota archaeon]